jgi:phage terminase large subunit-like protein
MSATWSNRQLARTVVRRRAANRAIGFFGFLKQSKGEWGGQGLALQPWQKFIVGSVFGWKRADGLRRFRVAYIEFPERTVNRLSRPVSVSTC